jgi:YVTN family beta-propeller protein
VVARIVCLGILTVAVAGVASAGTPLKAARIAARIPSGMAPCSENAGFGAMWVSNAVDATIARIDPATNKVTGVAKVGKGPCGVVASDDALWIDGYGTSMLERVDPQTLQVTDRIPIGPSFWDVEFGAGSVWATSEFDGTVARVDPTARKIVATVHVGKAPRQVRYGLGAIWVGENSGKAIYRVDPATNKARAVPTGLSQPDSVAVSRTAIWVVSSSDQYAVRLSPRTLNPVAKVKVGGGPANPAFASDGSVFIPNHWDGTVSRIDQRTNKVIATYKVGLKPFPAAAGFGDVWVPVTGANRVVRFHVG